MNSNSQIAIRKLDEADFFPLMECHLSAFASEKGEAMMRALDLTLEESEAFARPVVEKAIAEGLSLVAWDKPTEKIVGFCLNEPFGTIPDYLKYPLPAKLRPLYAFLQQLDRYCLSDIRVSTQKLFHLFNLGVLRDYRRSGVAKRLMLESLEVAKTHGYEYAVAEATGKGSQTLCEEIGFQRLRSMAYAEFEFEGGYPFRSIVEPDRCELIGITI